MPELPEVETVRRGLEPVLADQVLTRAILRRSDLRRPVPDGFAAALTGARVETVGRRAKYLLVGLDRGRTVLWHLGMSGSVRIFHEPPPPPGRHDHLDLRTTAGVTVRFTDPRRFGSLDLTVSADLAAHPLLRDLGPEPLGNAFNGAVLQAALAGRRTPLKAALLDQRVVAGLGNIYVCEALYRAGLSPRRLARTVGRGRAEKLAAAIRAVLIEAIDAGGSTLRDHRLTDGTLGYFSHHFAVYDQAGKPCPACDCGARDGATGAGVRRIIQAGRSTFYCPDRQR